MQSTLSQRILKLFIFSVTLSLLAEASLNAEASQDDSKPNPKVLTNEEFRELLAERKNEHCDKKRMETVIRYPGCSSLITKVNYCTGSCFSYATQSLEHPYDTNSPFQCCVAHRIHVKKRTLNFRNCTDAEPGELMQKTIYFPYIKDCHCTSPNSIANPIVLYQT